MIPYHLFALCFLLILLPESLSQSQPKSICWKSKTGETTVMDAWGSSSIRVRVVPAGESVTDPEIQALLPFTTTQCVNGNSITNGNLQVSITNDKLSILRVSDKKTLLQESSHSFSKRQGLDAGQYEAALTFLPNAQEQVYGLGEHRTGRLENKPIHLDFQHSQVYSDSHGADISIPFYVSSLRYGFLWNLPSFGFVAIDDTQTAWFSNSTSQIDFWVTTTEDTSTTPFQDIMKHYANATGFPPLLPFHASGFWQCKNRYRNQSELINIANGYISRSIPLSIIVVDYFHWVHFGDWSFNPECWADPLGMSEQLLEQGVNMMVSVWPLVGKASRNFEPMKSKGFLVKNSSGEAFPAHNNAQYLYDPFNEKAREYVFEQVKQGYYNNKIKIYWLDADEPERSNPDQSGQYFYDGGRDLQVGMAFPRMHQQTFHDGLTSLGEKDIIMLSRSAWAGTARYGSAVWSGDIPSTFSELSTQVRVLQNMAMSGIYWWTTDIGGYSGGNIDSPEFQELIVRWFQFGCFSPLFRLHGHRSPADANSKCGTSGGPNEVWRFGKTAYPIIVDVILLREQLRNYIMEQMEIASKTGTPVSRPMFFDFPEDDECWKADDQFMFGPDWLVAPVISYQAKSRSVYLPALPSGEVWTHHYTQQDFSAGTHVVDTPLDSFPLFYRRHK